MAKIHEEIIVIKLSKLIKDSTTGPVLANDDLIESLVSVVEELVPSDMVVEVERT